MKVLGIDIGGTNVDVVVYDGVKFEYVKSERTSNIPDFTEFLSEIIEETEVNIVGIGIAAWLRGKPPKPVFAPNLDDVESFNFDDFPIKLVIENDANCFALYASHSLKINNLLGVTVGTGVGSGIVFDGKLYRGMGMAGEIGHVVVVEDGRLCGCGGKGHLEAYFGGRAYSLEGKDVKKLVESEEIYATEGFLLFCRTIANSIKLLDPEAVVLGGRIGMNLNVDIVKDCVYSYLPPFYQTKILTLKDELSVAKGACLVCFENL